MRAAAPKKARPAKARPAAGARRARAAGDERGLGVVRQILSGYAARGVFTDFAERPARGGGAVFQFRWYHGARLQLNYRPHSRGKFAGRAAGELIFERLLPGIRAGGAMESELKVFLDGLASAKMPAHRRMNPKKERILYSIRSGAASIGLLFPRGSGERAARKAVNLAAEVFTRFLTRPYYDYMAKHFGVKDE